MTGLEADKPVASSVVLAAFAAQCALRRQPRSRGTCRLPAPVPRWSRPDPRLPDPEGAVERAGSDGPSR